MVQTIDDYDDDNRISDVFLVCRSYRTEFEASRQNPESTLKKKQIFSRNDYVKMVNSIDDVIPTLSIEFLYFLCYQTATSNVIFL